MIMLPAVVETADWRRTTSLSELDLSHCGLEDPHAQRLAKAPSKWHVCMGKIIPSIPVCGCSKAFVNS